MQQTTKLWNVGRVRSNYDDFLDCYSKIWIKQEQSDADKGNEGKQMWRRFLLITTRRFEGYGLGQRKTNFLYIILFEVQLDSETLSEKAQFLLNGKSWT